MTGAQKAAVILSVAALGFATLHIRLGTSLNRPATARPRSAATAEKSAANQAIQTAPEAADPLADPTANLKAALTEPSGRKIPYARVDQAIAAFGANAGAALPVLLSVLNAPPSARDLQAFVLAAHGLALLGTNAAPAWPELRSLLRSGKLAILNDDLPKLLVAISPDGAILPDLIDLLKANPGGAGRIAWSIDQIVQNRPALADRYTPGLLSMLSDPAEDVRRNAASVLARFPGEKSPEAVPVLMSALKLEKFLDPHAYDPLTLPDNSIYIRDGEKFTDDDSRLQSIQALGDFGPGATNAIPALAEIASLDRTNNLALGKFALLAIGKIDPDTTNSAAQLATREQARATLLAKRAQDGMATLPELKEALHLQNDRAIAAAADRLQALGSEANEALPDLLQALDGKPTLASFNIAQLLKELAPEQLVGRLKQKDAPNLNEIVSAIGELGASMSYALPDLEALLSNISPNDYGMIETVGEAIQKINPGYPKMIYHFNDLHEPFAALVSAIEVEDKTASPIYDAYIREYQDWNEMPRPKLLRFVETTKADPELHRVFVTKLLEKNPELAAVVK